jgi:hypothetical protein
MKEGHLGNEGGFRNSEFGIRNGLALRTFESGRKEGEIGRVEENDNWRMFIRVIPPLKGAGGCFAGKYSNPVEIHKGIYNKFGSQNKNNSV